MRNHLKRLLLVLLCLSWSARAQAQLSFYTNSGAITISGYNPAGGPNVVIPSTTNGFPVTIIDQFAFQYLTITNVVIPNSILMISNYAFYGCQRLTNVTFPASLIAVGRLPFSYCTNLQSISVNISNTALSSLGGVLFNKSQTRIFQCPNGLRGSYTIPGTVASLELGSFASTQLSDVTIPASVTNIENYSFDYCPNLTNFTVAGANPAFVSLNGVLFNHNQTTIRAFPGAISGTYAIPNTVTNIGAAAFDYTLLSKIFLPNSVRNIELLAFGDCPNLTSIVIPASVTNVMYGAFDGSYALTHAYFLGHQPRADFDDPATVPIFMYPTTVFYLPGKTNWQYKFGNAPTVLWNPQITDLSLGGGELKANINMPSNSIIVVETCTNLAQPMWMPLATNAYDGAAQSTFYDPQAPAHPTRLYRLRTP